MPGNVTLPGGAAARLCAGAGAGERSFVVRAAARSEERFRRRPAWRSAAGASPGAVLALARDRPCFSGVARLAGWAMAEASVGIAIGVAMAFMLDVFAMAAQMLGVQAGLLPTLPLSTRSLRADSGRPGGLRPACGRHAVLRRGARPRGGAAIRAPAWTRYRPGLTSSARYRRNRSLAWAALCLRSAHGWPFPWSRCSRSSIWRWRCSAA